MAKKLNPNSNTKNDFVQAYNNQLAEIEELKKALANPKEELLEKQTLETLAIADKVVNANMADTVKTLQEQVTGLLGSLVTQVSTGSEELKALNESIKIKKSELKELFDIEAKAYSLTALINAEKQAEIDHNAKVELRRDELNSTIAELNSQINSLKDTLDARLSDIDKQVIDARQRAMDELNYEIDRKKKVDNDIWEDEKKKRETELREEEKELEKKILEIELREKAVVENEEKLASIPQLIEQAKNEGYEAGKEKAEKAEGYKTRAIEAALKAEKSILQNKIDMLEERLESATNEILQYKEDLKVAYDKLSETAKATVEAGANKAIISQYESALKDKNKNN